MTKDGVPRSHSKNGNLLDDGTRLLNYDYKNRLISVADKASGNPVAQYFYFADNRRARKVVFGSPNVTTDFFYDGWQVCEERSSASGTTTWVYSPVYVDEPVQMVTGAGAFFLHQNARADVCAVTDGSGAVVERRFYDDFGRAFDGNKQPVAGSAVGNPYGFQGRRLDAETGLWFFRNRYYDPKTGRFLQRDPVWDAGNFGGQYSFVGNGPVSRRDSLGLQGPVKRDLENMEEEGIAPYGAPNPNAPPKDIWKADDTKPFAAPRSKKQKELAKEAKKILGPVFDQLEGLAETSYRFMGPKTTVSGEREKVASEKGGVIFRLKKTGQVSFRFKDPGGETFDPMYYDMLKKELRDEYGDECEVLATFHTHTTVGEDVYAVAESNLSGRRQVKEIGAGPSEKDRELFRKGKAGADIHFVIQESRLYTSTYVWTFVRGEAGKHGEVRPAEVYEDR